MNQRRNSLVDQQKNSMGDAESYRWGKRQRLGTMSTSLTRIICYSILIFTGQHSSKYQASAQLGVTICACSPRSYEFTLDFALNCGTNVIYGEGVSSTTCAIEPFQGDDDIDLVPVVVSSIDIIELDQAFNLLSQASGFGPFLNGSTFSFTSVTDNMTIFNQTTGGDPTMVPTALQLSLLGQNAAGESIYFTALIVYVDNCTITNTILVNSTIGWFRLTEATEALEEFCPAAYNNISLVPTQTAFDFSSKPSPSATTVPVPTIPDTTASPAVTVPNILAPPVFITLSPRSTKAPIRAISTKQPSYMKPFMAPQSSPTIGPTPCPIDWNGKGKGKGKSKKSGKGKGKGGKDDKSKKKGGKGKGYSDEVFVELFRNEHDVECSSLKSSKSGKGKGGGSEKGKGGKGGGKGGEGIQPPKIPTSVPIRKPSESSIKVPTPSSVKMPSTSPPTSSSVKMPSNRPPTLSSVLNPAIRPPSLTTPVPSVSPSIVPSVTNVTTFRNRDSSIYGGNGYINSFYDNAKVNGYEPAITSSNSSTTDSSTTSSISSNNLLMSGIIAVSSACFAMTLVLGRKYYTEQKKRRQEKALSVMKGLLSN